MSREVQIGDFLHRIKRPVFLEPSRKYKLVTIKLKHKGVVLRQEKLGSEIKSKMFEVKAGDFILSGIDARNGAFGIVPQELDGAIVTNDFWYFKIDDSIVDKELFLELTSTNWFDEICRKGSDGTTERIRLQKAKFFDQKIMLPKRSEQTEFISRFKSLKLKALALASELCQQRVLLKKLRQQILQDSIDGSLSETWREDNLGVESSSELLKRIAAKKKQLLKDKKIRKPKPLPAIKGKEELLPLPQSWVWCRLENTGLFERGKSKHRPRNDETLFVDGIYPFIQTGDVAQSKNNNYQIKAYTKSYNEWGLSQSRLWKKGTLCITIAANIAETGFLHIDACFPDSVVGFTSLTGEITAKYIRYFIDATKSEIAKYAPATAQKNINLGIINLLACPFPPLKEQEEIVRKVESLFSTCDHLEAQISKNQSYADQLMRAMLKDVFAQTEEKKQTINNVVELKPVKSKRIDYYKRTLLAAEVVHQLHKEPTLGHLKLQKIIFLCQKTQNMQLPTNFLQQVAGPYDPKMARSLDKQLKDKKWFSYDREASLKYQPLQNAGSHKADFQKYFRSELEDINHLFSLFKTKKSSEMEAIATLYACWEEMLNSGMDFSNPALIEKFYNWSEEKKKFSEHQLNLVIEWMNKHGIIPR